MNVNYNAISKIYDDVRQADVELINSFLEELEISTATRILDIGCGTGNNTHLLQKITPARLFGLDPSGGMLAKARQKNHNITFQQGHGENIPFESNFFDFVYMTDVIHHVPNILNMFGEIYRVLKWGGKVCILTQSHRQIEERPIVTFFPETSIVDKKRYPAIDEIVTAATACHLKTVKTETLYAGETVDLDADYLVLVEKKGYSMLYIISNEAYIRGVDVLKSTLKQGNIAAKLSGVTLVWFIKR